MRNFAAEFYSNLRLLDAFLSPFHQGILNQDNSRGVKWFLRQWPLWYSCLWICFYAYLILVQTAGPQIVSQQMLSMFCIVQLAAKQLNAKGQGQLLQELLKWCEDIYTKRIKTEFQTVVDGVFEKTNATITTCIR